MKPPEQQRTREYGPHPVPRTARRFPHIGAYFADAGPRQFAGGPNVTGNTLAEEICRPLTAWAREEVLG
jgi:hypothetical protein